MKSIHFIILCKSISNFRLWLMYIDIYVFTIPVANKQKSEFHFFRGCILSMFDYWTLVSTGGTMIPLWSVTIHFDGEGIKTIHNLDRRITSLIFLQLGWLPCGMLFETRGHKGENSSCTAIWPVPLYGKSFGL